ncbi:uncharacterized protein LOC124412770 [Diprion similis]|uniref:uncharacterized protein LOC124412770 n=1 Tax=Diprion similis TaxID=362088 RepID=UPI001EF972C5|nr:uncharacterized protein LOC124412770 [Diprion similis]
MCINRMEKNSLHHYYYCYYGYDLFTQTPPLQGRIEWIEVSNIRFHILYIEQLIHIQTIGAGTSKPASMTSYAQAIDKSVQTQARFPSSIANVPNRVSYDITHMTPEIQTCADATWLLANQNVRRPYFFALLCIIWDINEMPNMLRASGLIALQRESDELLQKGQFQLRKWRASDRRILENISKEREADSLLTIDKEGPLKTLLLLWDSNSDSMQYSVKIDESSKITKRVILSKIAQIFDPLGLLGPAIINAKCIMQKMWQLKTGWDELLPPEIQNTWTEFYRSLPKINNVRIARNVNPKNAKETFDLVGFGDASEIAFGACLYAVSGDLKGNKQSHLIGSKGRVAPLKTISLPRLELNAALLLVKLCDTARQAYGNKIRKVFLWSDSTIVLSWISTLLNIRTMYAANRVMKIQELSQDATWLHVPSKENSADLLSRGITVDQWKQIDLWWRGPEWLRSEKWPKRIEVEVDMTETRSSAVLISTKTETFEVLRKFSSFGKLQRVIAFILRFKANTLGGKKNGPLSVDELENAEKAIMKLIQREAFATELQSIEQGAQVIKTSKVASLNPYIDGGGLLRVGGRLSKADIPETQKHPMILPSRHPITKLILKKEHIRLHHCGPENLLKPKTPEVMMGDLPKEGVHGSLRPLTTTGVDYAGPLQVRERRRRGRVHASKAWIAVFTCFATKAIHLELVAELTSESFLAVLRRFVARRGICSQIVSDNSTNFVGADGELKEVFEFLEKEGNTISEYLFQQKITWKFIPPRAPQIGGLWEAAVKATKRQLNTVTKGLVPTFEEYLTLLTVTRQSAVGPNTCSPVNRFLKSTRCHHLVTRPRTPRAARNPHEPRATPRAARNP